jgi:hypothetical protein
MPEYIFLDADVNDIMFLISNSICLLLVYVKVIGFYILTLHSAIML